jgi:lipopolysaccharide export LptBFGC system permease protein LptF
MQVRKQNPNRWYLVMVFCILVAFCVFIIAPRIGYSQENAHALAIMIGVWAPTLGILGVRAELMRKKDE